MSVKKLSGVLFFFACVSAFFFNSLAEIIDFWSPSLDFSELLKCHPFTAPHGTFCHCLNLPKHFSPPHNQIVEFFLHLIVESFFYYLRLLSKFFTSSIWTIVLTIPRSTVGRKYRLLWHLMIFYFEKHWRHIADRPVLPNAVLFSPCVHSWNVTIDFTKHKFLWIYTNAVLAYILLSKQF